MSPRRSPQRLRPPTPRRPVRKRILVLCEGEVTEVEYVRHAVARERAQRADPEHGRPGRKGTNPSSNVWLVVEAIASSGKP